MIDNDLFNVIDRFHDFRVAVIGEAMLDSYLVGQADRLCREAPVPVVTVEARRDLPGGAANTAVNVQALGGQVIFLSVVGNDVEGEKITRLLEQDGIDISRVIVCQRRSSLVKQRVVAGAQMVVRFDQGTTSDLDHETEKQLIHHLGEVFQEADALIISDYGYGILTPRVILALAALQREHPRVIVADSKKLKAFAGIGLTAVKPNFPETSELLSIEKPASSAARPSLIAQHGERILDLTGAQIAAVTMDQDGALIFERGQSAYRTYARPEPHSKAAGAGDTFTAALTLGLLARLHVPTVAEIASAAAAIVVGKEGTSICTAEELKACFVSDEKFVSDAFFLAARISAYRRQGKKIVFTNGCFDILHRGHIAYLNHAKSFGDVLIVGINSDPSVRRLKGSNRPINALEDRAQVLAAMSSVDHIIPFDSDTPIELIRGIQPDVYVKGGDYTRESLPEAQIVESLGGKVEILPYLQDRSTSGVIERIRKLYASAD
jgi:D-beta-D-heptose 7-phosphate kinase / D-beta-D-heptose 1-phosphate adenosyltransferase